MFTKETWELLKKLPKKHQLSYLLVRAYEQDIKNSHHLGDRDSIKELRKTITQIYEDHLLELTEEVDSTSSSTSGESTPSSSSSETEVIRPTRAKQVKFEEKKDPLEENFGPWSSPISSDNEN